MMRVTWEFEGCFEFKSVSKKIFLFRSFVFEFSSHYKDFWNMFEAFIVLIYMFYIVARTAQRLAKALEKEKKSS